MRFKRGRETENHLMKCEISSQRNYQTVQQQRWWWQHRNGNKKRNDLSLKCLKMFFVVAIFILHFVCHRDTTENKMITPF